MAKHTIKEQLNRFSWDDFEDKTVGEVIAELQEFAPSALFEADYGYEYAYGILYTYRLETDEEEAAREAEEAAKSAKKQKDYEDSLLSAAIREEKYLASKNANEVALWAYLQKHKDSPRKGDLGNLYLTLLNLEAAGHGYDSIAAREIRECMARLEGE